VYKTVFAGVITNLVWVNLNWGTQVMKKVIGQLKRQNTQEYMSHPAHQNNLHWKVLQGHTGNPKI